MEEQNERLRQQLEEQAVELMVKEKELKKIKFNQLLIDTQATFMQEGMKGAPPGRHSNTVVQPRASDGGLEKGDENAAGEQEQVSRNSQTKPDASAQAAEGAVAKAEAVPSEANKAQDASSSQKPKQIDGGSDVKSMEGSAPPQPQSAGANNARQDGENEPGVQNPNDSQPPLIAQQPSAGKDSGKGDQAENEGEQNGAKNSPGPSAAGPPEPVEASLSDKAGRSVQESPERGPIQVEDVVVEDVADDGPSAEKLRAGKVSNAARLAGDQAYASFAGNAAIGAGGADLAGADKLLGLGDLDPAEFLKNLQLDGEHDESAAAALGLGDIQIDELLDCGDDLMDIEQTAFIGSSKVMLKMLDNMIQTIDARVESVKMHPNLYNVN